MSWRHPTTILREEFTARGVLVAPRRTEPPTPTPWWVHLHSEKRDGRWFSWIEVQNKAEHGQAVEQALAAITAKHGIERRPLMFGEALAWPMSDEEGTS